MKAGDKCPVCGTELTGDASSCVTCGTNFSDDRGNIEIRCPECTALLPEGAKSCQECGTHVVIEDTPGKYEGEEDEETDVVDEVKDDVGEPETVVVEKIDFDLSDVDEKLKELMKVPGIGPLKAKTLFEAGFTDLRHLKRASVVELVAIKGIGKKDAGRIKAELRDKDLLEIRRSELSDSGIVKEYQCPLCGTIVSEHENQCYECGTMLKHEEDLEEDDTRKALSYYDEKLLQEPDNAELWYARGATLMGMEDYDLALTSLDKAIEIEPEYQNAWISKAELFNKIGEPLSAAECFTHVISSTSTVADDYKGISEEEADIDKVEPDISDLPAEEASTRDERLAEEASTRDDKLVEEALTAEAEPVEETEFPVEEKAGEDTAEEASTRDGSLVEEASAGDDRLAEEGPSIDLDIKPGFLAEAEDDISDEPDVEESEPEIVGTAHEPEVPVIEETSGPEPEVEAEPEMATKSVSVPDVEESAAEPIEETSEGMKIADEETSEGMEIADEEATVIEEVGSAPEPEVAEAVPEPIVEEPAFTEPPVEGSSAADPVPEPVIEETVAEQIDKTEPEPAQEIPAEPEDASAGDGKPAEAVPESEAKPVVVEPREIVLEEKNGAEAEESLEELNPKILRKMLSDHAAGVKPLLMLAKEMDVDLNEQKVTITKAVKESKKGNYPEAIKMMKIGKKSINDLFRQKIQENLGVLADMARDVKMEGHDVTEIIDTISNAKIRLEKENFKEAFDLMNDCLATLETIRSS